MSATPSTSDVPARDGDAPAQPVLTGARCLRCDRVSLPVQRFGCEQCGAHGDQLEPVPLSGRGSVLAAVVVHEHPQPDVPTPAVIGSVLLEEGPVLRALLVDPDGSVADDLGWSGRGVRLVPAGSPGSASMAFTPTGGAA